MTVPARNAVLKHRKFSFSLSQLSKSTLYAKFSFVYFDLLRTMATTTVVKVTMDDA
jgi:hypothetical protein